MNLTKALVGGSCAGVFLWICIDSMVGIGNDYSWLRSYEPLRLPLLVGLILAVDSVIVIVYLVDRNASK